MCFSSLVLSRRPKIFPKRPKTLKNPLTPIGSCRDLHMYLHMFTHMFYNYTLASICTDYVNSAAHNNPRQASIRNSQHEPIGVRGG